MIASINDFTPGMDASLSCTAMRTQHQTRASAISRWQTPAPQQWLARIRVINEVLSPAQSVKINEILF
jgi:hypothetical protein